MTQGPTNDQKHTSYGITIKRDLDTPKQEDDGSFNSSHPEVPVSEDAERLGHCKPPVIDHTPALPALEQAKEQAQAKGNDLLAALLAKAGEAARELAKKVGISQKERAPRGEKKKVSLIEIVPAPSPCPVIWTQADVLSDEEFIKRTISSIDYNEHSSGSIHSEESKRLFWANGGARYIEIGLMYGPAFDNLRADKIRAVRIKNNPALQEIIEGEWKRNQSTFPYDAKVYVAGLPTVEKFIAIAAAEHREADLMWMEERIENIHPAPEEDEEKEEDQ
jgi:hypothetical protein